MTSGINLKGGNQQKRVGGCSVEIGIRAFTLVFHLFQDLAFMHWHQLFWPPATFLLLLRAAGLIPCYGDVYDAPWDIHLSKMSNCIQFPFCLIILVKIDDNLTTRFKFEVLHGGADSY